MQLQLITQTEIATEHDSMLAGYNTAGTANVRWTVSNHYQAINYATRQWVGKVAIPHLYTVSGGWVSGTYEYTLPEYMDEPITPQFKVPGLATDLALPGGVGDEDWIPFARWSVEPSATEGRVLRLAVSPRSADGRILWQSSNGPVPTSATLPKIAADMTASSTSVLLNSKPLIGKSGYIKIDSEWMFYAGYTEGASALTLTNLVRGLHGTTAATHDGTGTAATVYWGVAVTDPGHWNWLFLLCGVFLHMLPLNLASDTQRDHHEFQLRYFQQQANEYAVGIRPTGKSSIRLRGARY